MNHPVYNRQPISELSAEELAERHVFDDEVLGRIGVGGFVRGAFEATLFLTGEADESVLEGTNFSYVDGKLGGVLDDGLTIDRSTDTLDRYLASHTVHSSKLA